MKWPRRRLIIWLIRYKFHSNAQQANQLLVEYQNKRFALATGYGGKHQQHYFRTESQRAQLQTQLATLPKSLDADHPNLVMLRQAISSVNSQIAQEKARLANPSGKTLNVSMEEFQRLQMDAAFKQDVYKSSLAALEKGRFDAARMLDKVSVLQSPSLPEFPLEPRRLYNILATLIIAAMLPCWHTQVVGRHCAGPPRLMTP
jgi:capsular polysaccharide transport system permease protein